MSAWVWRPSCSSCGLGMLPHGNASYRCPQCGATAYTAMVHRTSANIDEGDMAPEPPEPPLIPDELVAAAEALLRRARGEE